MPSAEDDRFEHWKADLQKENMLDVLNAMEAIARTGDWPALGLLTIAGENLSSMFRSMSITTAGGKMKFEEYRQDCIRRLQGRLGAKASRVEVRSESPRFFISYNHSDREEATALALDLARSKADVFLDHWEMAPHEEILPRIERELNESDVVVALLSPRAAESSWVRRELEIVSARQASRGGVRLIPVLLEDCALPVPIASRPYHDLRDRRRRPMVVQSILNQVLGYKPFSQRVMEFLSKPAADSPYMPNAQRNGRKMLEALGRCEEMEIANNQKWFLWEAFHKLLGDYTCTLKMGIQRQSATAKRYEFTIIDRWNNQGNVVILTADEFDRGLWQGEVDLLGRGTTESSRLRFLGTTGRFSVHGEYSPDVGKNAGDMTAEERVKPLLMSMLKLGESFDEGSRQSFLFDYQRLVLPGDWHRVKVVVGSVQGGETLAYSPMLMPASRDTRCGVFELYDPFFSSLKYTCAYKSQLEHVWGADVDLMSAGSETLLGLT